MAKRLRWYVALERFAGLAQAEILRCAPNREPQYVTTSPDHQTFAFWIGERGQLQVLRLSQDEVS